MQENIGLMAMNAITHDRVCHVDVTELVAFQDRRDHPLLKNNGRVDFEKIPGCQLLKLAARFAESQPRDKVAIFYRHQNARSSSNNYEPEMLLVDSSKVFVPSECISVGRKSIGVNGYVALKPFARHAIRLSMMKKS